MQKKQRNLADKVKAEIKEPATEISKSVEERKAEIAEHEKKITEDFLKEYRALCEKYNRQVTHAPIQLIAKPIK